MKKLKKIKLINWHSFLNETIEINNNCLVTGENGSGKSTFLDAIQYVLTAGKTKFNQAADDTNKRTLETYIRGKVGYDNKEFLRNGDITSYIALEFFDEEKQVKDLLGSVIEFSVSMNKPNHAFFRISETSINDELFIVGDYIKTMNEFSHTKNIEMTSNSKEFQAWINAFLGLSGKGKYFELLPKSLAFKPIKDVNQFVTDFLLPERNISLEALQQNIENFSKLEKEIEIEEEKIKKLEEIETCNNEYMKKSADLERNSYFQKALRKKVLNDSIVSKNKKIEDNNRNIEAKMIIRISREKVLADNNKLILDYEKKLAGNEEYNLILQWNNKLNSIKLEQEELVPQVENYRSALECELIKMSAFSWMDFFRKNSSPSDYNTYVMEFSKCVDKCKEERELYREKRFLTYNEKLEIEKVRSEVHENLNNLKKNKLVYNNSLTLLQSAIKEYLRNQTGKDVEIRPLCEYLEIIDEKWRDAIEGYLNTQRFDLIIDPIYFDEALLVYERIKQEKNIYGIGLVNTGKLKDEVPVENTLGNKISSRNVYANRYALSILNKVTCCEDISDLKKYSNSITPSCMTYKNNVARQINPKVYKDYYIGKKALEVKLKETEEEAEQIDNKYKDIAKLYDDICTKFDILNESRLEELFNKKDILRKYSYLKEEYVKAEQHRDAIKIDGLINNVHECIINLREENITIEKEINSLFEEIAKSKNKIDELNEKIVEDKKELEELSVYAVNDELEKVLLENLAKMSIEQYEKKLQNDEKSFIGEKQKLEGKIEMFLKLYNEFYQFDEIPIFSNIDSYLKELYKKRERDIVDRKSKSVEFKESCQISFQEDFLCKLKEQIETAQREIHNLNRVLKPKRFGKEHYEFVYDKSKNLDMSNYYRIIMSGANYERQTLFDDDLSIEDKATLDELFNKIAATNTEVMTKKLLDEYTDYRNYMSYDIKITTDDGESYLFSKVSKEKSGGEIQTPFYVIIASAFEQLLTSPRRNGSTGCIVMFDEAFNNMDENRIEAMMHFYKELNIQLLIAVPSEKVHIIAPYVDTTLVVINSSDNAFIKNVRYEELEYV